jgi:hypothetical protein
MLFQGTDVRELTTETTSRGCIYAGTFQGSREAYTALTYDEK